MFVLPAVNQLRGAVAPCQAGIDLKLFFSKVEKGFSKYIFFLQDQDELIIPVWQQLWNEGCVVFCEVRVSSK